MRRAFLVGIELRGGHAPQWEGRFDLVIQLPPQAPWWIDGYGLHCNLIM